MLVTREVAHLAFGVACALRTLMWAYTDPGSRPKVINEHQFALCELDASTASFNWVDCTELKLGLPSIHAVRELVLILTTHLRMTSKDLVVAFVCFEECLRRNSAVLRTSTCRPMFIACCIIALKVTRDHVTTLASCYRTLKGIFTALTPVHLKYLEMKVLETMEWHVPMSDVYQVYADALVAEANKVSGASESSPRVVASDDAGV